MATEYQEALDFLLGFTDWRKPVVHRPDAALNLPRMRRLLDLLDAPDRAYPAVVIAGTKGKGSTAAILAAIARAAGLRVALYSQPHLHDYRERARVDGAPIAREELVAVTARLRPAIMTLQERWPELGRPSTYDAGTALALRHFADRAVDLAVLEVGLGGRFDSVNTVTPLVSGITAISLDHTAVLGDTIEQIAAEKAGIIKPGVPVVAQAQPPAARVVLAATAGRVGAPLYQAEELARVAPTASQPSPLTGRQRLAMTFAPGFAPRGGDTGPLEAELPLLGAFQRPNAATAIALALLLARRLPPLARGLDATALARGLAAARWPGRLEIVRQSPLTIVDGAHNADSAARLRQALRELFPGRALTLVLGASLDKDIAGILRALAPAAARLVLTVSSHARSAPLELLRGEVARLGLPANAPVDERATVAEALAFASATADARGLVCATGSLFVVADAREALGLAGAPVAV